LWGWRRSSLHGKFALLGRGGWNCVCDADAAVVITMRFGLELGRHR